MLKKKAFQWLLPINFKVASYCISQFSPLFLRKEEEETGFKIKSVVYV